MAENNAEETLEQSEPGAEQRKPTDGIVTVVLTADNHLGYTTFTQNPRRREERQQRLRQAFQRVTDFAAGQRVDLFIQAGDLFDTTNPDERDRSFVAERLAQLRQAGVRTIALGGVHDTPGDPRASSNEDTPAPQLSYARLGALHYFPPQPPSLPELEPLIFEIRGVRIAICGLGILPGQKGNPLADVSIQEDIEGASIKLLILHAPIEGLAAGSSLLDARAQVSRTSIASQSAFDYILAGYHHAYRRLRIGHCDVIVAGATQRLDFTDPDDDPGFVFLGLAADGVRWCSHIAVDSLPLRRLVVHTHELWPDGTEYIIEHLRPLCDAHALVQLRLEGELTRKQYHQLDLNKIRRYGQEHCFALAIDDSALTLLPVDSSTSDEESAAAGVGERLSLREELITLADEWIAAATDEPEKKALQATKEELLAALDDVKR